MALTMRNHIYQILEDYKAGDRSENWFSATIMNKAGSSYRWPGALMLISPLGKTFGLVSGGCLEADIVRRAQNVYHQQQPDYVVYDSTEEGNIAAELGLGCNGRVGVLVQQLSSSHEQLLLTMLDQLQCGHSPQLLQCYSDAEDGNVMAQLVLLDESGHVMSSTADVPLPSIPELGSKKHAVISDGKREWAVAKHMPPPSLWIVGGGVDAQPMVNLAVLLGWRVTVVDHRTSYARVSDFRGAEHIIRDTPENYCGELDGDAAIVMSHNLSIDAAWIKRLKGAKKLRYLGLLGPVSRKREVFELADVDSQSEFAASVYGPMGFDIGGDLPESIALSVISQCHAVLNDKSADSKTSFNEQVRVPTMSCCR